MNTRRYPRTLEEAFGPGHRGGILQERVPMDTNDKIVVFGCAMALIALGVGALMGWL